MLRLIHLRKVGQREHRSGWPYVLNSLQPIFDEHSPVLFDDFVERTFLYDHSWANELVHESPWVAAIHHPPDMPKWYLPNMHLQRLEANPRWQRSLPTLRMAVSFGNNLTRWLNRQYPQLPVVTLKHPTGMPTVYWTPDKFLCNKQKKLAQIGWFLRNTQAIYHVPEVSGFTKLHLAQEYNWVQWAHWACGKTSPQLHPDRMCQGVTEKVANLDDTQYDILLANNVVFIELISAVANNTVVECIARNTPLVVNRHPGPKYYLGNDYPLYYDHIDEVPELLTTERIIAAHEYIKGLDKTWIRGSIFREDFYEACRRHVPELAYRPPLTDEIKCLL